MPKVDGLLRMDLIPENAPRRKRKNRYIPDLAAAKFRPTEDWTIQQARDGYEKASFPFVTDTILYQDCIEGMRKLPNDSVDVVIADPPFGLNFTGKESIYNRDARLIRSGYEEVKGDYGEFSEKWMQELPRIMKKTSTAWIFSGWSNLGDILNAVGKSGLKLLNHIIWKYQFGVFTRRRFVTSHYHVLFLAKSDDYYFNKIIHYPLDVWEINRTYRRGEIKNSTKLPEELIVKCIDFSSRPGHLILDPFMGNGTTAVAAEGTFRHYLGFEINSAMKSVIDNNLKSVKIGQFYTPYTQRIDDLVRRARLRYGTKIGEKELLMRLDQFQS